MGYCIFQGKSAFFMGNETLDRALKAIQGLHGKETIKDSSGKHFYWVANEFYLHDNLPHMLREWRWDASMDGDGNVVGLSFSGEKSGDDLILFGAIAPFVKKGSYIEMEGEDGECWKWVFNGKTCREE